MENNGDLILNNFFSKNTFRNLIDGRIAEKYNICINNYISEKKDLTNKMAINYIYKYLEKNYRNEYFYKNTLFNKLLLGRHSLNTTTALTEIPIAKSKADYIMINGEAVVYEIKTELDNFERLNSQIDDYYKAFTNVCLVTSESNYLKAKEKLKQTNVGIYVLTSRNTLSYRKKIMTDSTKLRYNEIFKIIRKNEFENLILSEFGYLPETTDFNYYKKCFELIKTINIEKLQSLMIKELKKRDKTMIEKYKNIVPYELRFIMYFLNLKKKDYKLLEQFLEKKWGD
ncbi:sce7726 family protein [Senegalia massiliensis]|uniref:Sce7726 family protein n=1 Tax=Senegalia massiliensis TaxID=1720316 RepID=A0A845R3B0_9CLOT|nr:sce7726 family protein [Senegalia massiliensis]NBI08078.1 hypothetical protein [Senegalia massiliensis]